MAKIREIEVSEGAHGVAKLKAFNLDGCLKLKSHRPGTKAREYRVCAVGGVGHGAQLQVMSPYARTPDGSEKAFIVGTTQKACRLTWPIIAYDGDYSPAAMASIREMHGGQRRRRR